MTFADAVEAAGKAIEAVGVTVIVVCSVVVLARYCVERGGVEAYHALRRRLGRVILVGLEVLVAGDIVRTVAVEPSFRSVGVLAAIVAIRTFLSTAIEVEIEGRWPWRRGPAEPGEGPG
ncbi:MAG TPA: DUF1622 domain-containing protein [Frankiaceae bacterium]|jgi:uncharacterized membrane protein|nr:DUF1622 domain-containing protein [Frankiaceae bacterium]